MTDPPCPECGAREWDDAPARHDDRRVCVACFCAVRIEDGAYDGLQLNLMRPDE